MNILRGIARWVCAFLLGAALSAWIILATVQATVLNRNVVESWLASSGIYNKALSSVLQVAPDTGGDNSLITPAILQQALAQTFDPAYLQKNVNVVINSTYDWLEGTTQKISFSIPVQAKATEFTQHLAALLVPELSKLPVCSTRAATNSEHITCVPQGVSPTDFAAQLTTLAGNSDFLKTPITQDSFASSGVPSVPWLPATVQAASMTATWLPVVIVVFGGLYVLASEDKIRGTLAVGRQIAINAGLTLIGGLFIWYATTSIDLSNTVGSADNQQAQLIVSVINPLARIILPDIGKALSLFSGIATAVGASVWIGFGIWQHKRGKSKLETTPLTHQKPEIVLPEPQKPTTGAPKKTS